MATDGEATEEETGDPEKFVIKIEVDKMVFTYYQRKLVFITFSTYLKKPPVFVSLFHRFSITHYYSLHEMRK